MSHSSGNRFLIENFCIQLIVRILGLVEFPLQQLFIDNKGIDSFFSGFHSSIQPQFDDPKDQAGVKDRDSEPSTKQKTRIDHQSASRGEVELVLRSLGMSCNSDEAKLPASLDAEDLFNLFEEEKPRLDEVKEAFDVFDDNKDGFIDAKELQKVLCALGLKEGSDMEDCRRMIGAFDENGDGRIDFDEFVKFMETNSC